MHTGLRSNRLDKKADVGWTKILLLLLILLTIIFAIIFSKKIAVRIDFFSRFFGG